MKTLLVVILTTALLWVPSRSETFQEETERAWKLEGAADVVVDYDEERGLDIGVTSKGSAVHFALGDLTSYFENLRHKDLIVVTASKVDLEDEAQQEQIRHLRDFLEKRGFRRIVVLECLNNGTHIFLDHKCPAPQAEQAGAGQPATRPKSKPENNKKHQSKSEGRSR